MVRPAGGKHRDRNPVDFRMTSAPIDAIERDRRAIRIWLLAVAALVLAMVVVGGATRLTESGLSITEWQPVAGALPPLSEAQWQLQFEKYKAIPQYQALNPGMSLDAFKTIFWWEWTHRLLGRADRGCVPAAVLVVSGAGQGGGAIAPPAVDAVRSRRVPGRGRLVDGGVGARRARRGLAIPAGLSSDARRPDLCGIALDRAGTGAPLRRPGAGPPARRAPSCSSDWCWRRSIWARWWRACGPVSSTTPGR